jgi:hypothetical protein
MQPFFIKPVGLLAVAIRPFPRAAAKARIALARLEV